MALNDWKIDTKKKDEILWINKKTNYEVVVASPYVNKKWVFIAFDNRGEIIEGNKKMHPNKSDAMRLARNFMRKH
jgi:hypothetical protein